MLGVLVPPSLPLDYCTNLHWVLAPLEQGIYFLRARRPLVLLSFSHHRPFTGHDPARVDSAPASIRMGLCKDIRFGMGLSSGLCTGQGTLSIWPSSEDSPSTW